MGFLKQIIKLRQDAEGIALDLPALMIQAERICQNVIHGTHSQRKSGSGENFWQFKPYHSSDRPQDIDWRQSARTDGVLVRQKERQATQKTYLWCAGGASMDFSSSPHQLSKQNCAHILAMASALLLRRGEEHIGVWGTPVTGKSDHHMEVIGHALLSSSEENDCLPNVDSFRPPQNSSAIIFSDFLNEIKYLNSFFNSISELYNGITLVHILDPMETELSYSGRVEFQNPIVSNSPPILIDHVPSVSDSYKARIDRHISDIQTLCTQYGWNYCFHRTDCDMSDSLRLMLDLHYFEGRTI